MTDLAACTDQSAYAKVVCLADQLKQAAGSELLARLQTAYTVADAKRWSNFPPGIYRDRVGPTLSEFTGDQAKLVKATLQEAMSKVPGEGWDEIQQTLNLDDYLTAKGGADYSSGQYHVAFLGTPAATGTWQLYFGGHHLAVTNTYKDGKLVGATPSFRGIEPFAATAQNGRDNAPLQEEQTALAAMLTALSTDQAAKAKLSQTFGDVLVGPQKDGQFPAMPSGVRAGDLSQTQQDLVMAAIGTYVNDVDEADATAIMARYRSELADTYVAFAGTSGVTAANDYVRIDGPSVWIEFSMQRGVVYPDPHPHSVWRDKQTDYGGNT